MKSNWEKFIFTIIKRSRE